MNLFFVTVSCWIGLASCSLLEMSQVLWARFVSGGLEHLGGSIDPLLVPVVKVDQSDGNASYRMVLRNLEIRGLNGSTLQSIHVGRGRVLANLSDMEAGYVSYNERGELDDVRYRFHTVVKERREPEIAESREELRESKDSDAIGHPEQPREPRRRPIQRPMTSEEPEAVRDHGGTSPGSLRAPTGEKRWKSVETERLTENVYPVYPTNYEVGSRFGPYDSVSPTSADGIVECARKYPRTCGSGAATGPEVGDGADQRARTPEFGRRGRPLSEASRSFDAPQRPNDEPDVFRGAQYSGIVFQQSDNPRNRLENRPGFVDVVYVDGKDQTLRRFSNLGRDVERIKNADDSGEPAKQNFRKSERFLIHNFNKLEQLTKKNNLTRVVNASNRIESLTRYAENYQERQGFFEQGMQLVYHFGRVGDLGENGTLYEQETNEAKRRKREHNPGDSEDDLVHVMVSIKVPILEVKANYQLSGKVGTEILRGNGQLDGNFTNLVADFTLELRKIGKNLMIVRAARARLTADDRAVALQGMDSKGPVESILTHGIMAAEAVAAMLADDLATKALAEDAGGAMTYKLYTNATAI